MNMALRWIQPPPRRDFRSHASHVSCPACWHELESKPSTTCVNLQVFPFYHTFFELFVGDALFLVLDGVCPREDPAAVVRATCMPALTRTGLAARSSPLAKGRMPQDRANNFLCQQSETSIAHLSERDVDMIMVRRWECYVD